MTNTYLFEIIKAFSPQKRQEMVFFLASPYFNRGKYAQEIVHLYQIVLSTAPNFAENSLQKEQVYALIFPNSSLESGKLERLIAELNKLLRMFALNDQYFQENNDEVQVLDWIRWLRIHGLSDSARKAFAKLKNGKTNEAEESLEQYRSLLHFAEEEIELVSLQDQYKCGRGN